MLIDFLAGFATGVLCVFGALGLLAAILIAWSRDEATKWLKGVS